MRIAILTRHFSRSGGGAESYAIAIAQALAARHEVHVFCQESDRPVPELHYHPVWRLSKRPRWFRLLNVNGRGHQRRGRMSGHLRAPQTRRYLPSVLPHWHNHPE